MFTNSTITMSYLQQITDKTKKIQFYTKQKACRSGQLQQALD